MLRGTCPNRRLIVHVCDLFFQLWEEKQNSPVMDVTAGAAHVTAGLVLGAADGPLLCIRSVKRATGKLIGWRLSGRADSLALAGALTQSHKLTYRLTHLRYEKTTTAQLGH